MADVIADSAWGRFYLQRKASGHPFYAGATFYTIEQLYRLLEEAGLTVAGSSSTLFREPEAAKTVTERPTPGIAPDASFVCLLAETG